MAEAREGTAPVAGESLAAWALAAFHAAVLLVVPLAVTHALAPGVVGDLLAGLDTHLGLGLYLVLWGSTWWSNRRYVAACSFAEPTETLRTGAKWGAVTGLPLLGCLVVAAALTTTPVFALLFLVVGGLAALVVGAVLGAVFAGVDVALDRVAATLVAETNSR